MRRLAIIASITGAITVGAGCGVDLPDGDPRTEATGQNIYSGTETSAYPEAVLIDVLNSGNTWGKQCSGVALTPSVVLTAAHCFIGYSKFRVTVPATGQAIETASKASHPSFHDTDEVTDKDTGFDAGLLFLPTKITISKFPQLWPSFTTASDTVRAIGRVSGGALSADKLYVSPARTLPERWASNPRYYLLSAATQEKGDSGGPVIHLDGSRHRLVAILAAGDATASAATRLDTIYDWIVLQIQAYTNAHRALAPSCGTTGYACELTPVLGGFPCSVGSAFAYCCDTPGTPIIDGQCAGKVAEPPPPPGDNPGGGLPPTSAPTVTMWDVAGHVRDQSAAPIAGVRVEVWGLGAAGYKKHYDSVTDSAGNFKVTGFIVKGGEYDVVVSANQTGQGFGSFRYPAFTSWLFHTRDQATKQDTPLGSVGYFHQRAGSDDCAGPDTTRSGNKRCDFMYTTDASPAHVLPPPPAGLRVTCDPSTPDKPRATIAWNAQPRATAGYLVRVDHRPSSFDTTACTGGAGSTGSADPFDRCVDGTTHTSLTVGPIERGAPYAAWIHSYNVEGAFSNPPSAINFVCP
jgi:hypothetical protein